MQTSEFVGHLIVGLIIDFLFFMIILKRFFIVCVNLVQLVETSHFICRNWCLNHGHSTYSPLRVKFLTIRLLDKKNNFI
jgi:hypothetical protein